MPGPRIRRELKTVTAMIRIYCRGHHGAAGSCAECLALDRYAHARLEGCRYGEDKPTCARCPTHCYSKAMAERMRVVMRYAGPRLARTHPFLALGHLVDGWRDRMRR